MILKCHVHALALKIDKGIRACTYVLKRLFMIVLLLYYHICIRHDNETLICELSGDVKKM